MNWDIKNILFTSDLSQASRHVFDYVLMLANSHNARIVILHILEGTSPASATIKTVLGNFLSSAQLEELRQIHKDEALTTLTGKSRHFSVIKEGIQIITKEAEAKYPGGFETDEVIVSEGNKVEEILRVAEAKKCDLIVVGTHHQSRLTETVVGSLSHNLIRKAEIPVLAVPIPKSLS